MRRVTCDLIQKLKGQILAGVGGNFGTAQLVRFTGTLRPIDD